MVQSSEFASRATALSALKGMHSKSCAAAVSWVRTTRTLCCARLVSPLPMLLRTVLIPDTICFMTSSAFLPGKAALKRSSQNMAVWMASSR